MTLPLQIKHVFEQDAIGDDRLQKQARGYVSPESFTHGTSQQRVFWFKKDLTEGTVQSCNTIDTD